MAQAIPLLLAPVIARIYTSSDFAIFADYISIFNLVAVVSTGRYSFAIVVAEKQKEAINLLALSVLIAGIVSIFSLLILIPLHSYIGIWLDNPELPKWLFFIPAGVLFFGLFEALSYWLNRTKYYKGIAGAKVSRSSTVGGVNIGLGLLELKKTGLIIAQVIGDFIAGLVSAVLFWKKDVKLLQKVNKADLKKVAVKYNDFPLFNSLQAFSDKFRESSIILIISFYFSDTISGSYFFGFKYARAPMALLTFALFQVLYQKFSEKKNKKEALLPLLKKILKRNIFISLAIFIILFFFAEPAFKIAFGERWDSAGYFVKILSFMLAANFLTSQISFLPLVLNKQKSFFLISIIYNFVVPILIFITAKISGNIETVVATLSLTMGIVFILIIFWFISMVKSFDLTNRAAGSKSISDEIKL